MKGEVVEGGEKDGAGVAGRLVADWLAGRRAGRQAGRQAVW